jgi:hypothetical protein
MASPGPQLVGGRGHTARSRRHTVLVRLDSLRCAVLGYTVLVIRVRPSTGDVEWGEAQFERATLELPVPALTADPVAVLVR